MHSLLEAAIALQRLPAASRTRWNASAASLWRWSISCVRRDSIAWSSRARSGDWRLDVLTFLRAAELMAEADGSVGWNLGNNAVGQLIALSLPKDGVDEIFGSGPDAIVAGTAVPGGGTGQRVEGGYLVSGRWPFGGGCRESQWMLCNFDVSVDGEPVLYRALLPSHEATILDNWDMSGIRGTGSHDWHIDNMFVPTRRTVRVEGGRLLVNQWRRWPGTLYALPVHGIVGPHHSVAATGVARAGIDAFEELAGAKIPRGRTGCCASRSASRKRSRARRPCWAPRKPFEPRSWVSYGRPRQAGRRPRSSSARAVAWPPATPSTVPARRWT